MFGDYGEYPTWFERVLFVLSIFLLPLVLLNLYISIVSDIFDEVLNNKEVAVNKVRLQLILTVGRIAWWSRKDRFQYLHYCTTELHQEEKVDTWEGKVRQLENSMKAEFDGLKIQQKESNA